LLHGTFAVGGVVEESLCRSSQDYRFTEIGIYKIHSTSLMPNIPFEEASIQPQEIDSSIFINDEETKLDFENMIQCQNFLTTRFIGRAPLEWYEGDNMTLMGRQFILICRNGDPDEEYRVFGTEAAIRGYNRGANDNTILPGGGEQYGSS
jgi:hypothetical protein